MNWSLTQSLFLLCLVSVPAHAEVYFRCANEKGESRVVQHVDTLPEDTAWTCEETEIVKMVGVPDPEGEDGEAKQGSQEQSDLPGTAVAQKDSENEPLTMERLQQEIKEYEIKEFEDTEEMEEFVEACGSPDRGRDCNESIRGVLKKMVERRKK